MKTKNIIKVFLSSGFFFGFAPFAPGTFGTIPAFIIYLIIIKFVNFSFLYSICLFVIFFLLAVYCSNWAMKYWNNKDPKQFVLDEICAYMLIATFFYNELSLKFLVYIFFIFRFFDVVKPPIARYFDKKEGGIYIVLDDIVSAFYSIATIFILKYFNLL